MLSLKWSKGVDKQSPTHTLVWSYAYAVYGAQSVIHFLVVFYPKYPLLHLLTHIHNCSSA